jgi:hypothetical protein
VGFYREIVAGRGGLDPSFIGVLLDGVLVAGLIAGDNCAYSPERSGAWCLEMAYEDARANLGPGNLLLLLAVGEAIKRGNKFLSFLQMFAYYKHRWKAEPIEVVNVQLIRRFTLHDLRGSLGELKRKWRPIRAQAAPAESGDDPGDAAGVGANAALPELDTARRLAAAACATAGTAMLRLNRAQAGDYLPFPLD